MNKSFRLFLITGLLFSGVFFLSREALADDELEFRPGWGFGDTNHLLIGPLGLSVLPQHPQHPPHLEFAFRPDRPDRPIRPPRPYLTSFLDYWGNLWEDLFD